MTLSSVTSAASQVAHQIGNGLRSGFNYAQKNPGKVTAIALGVITVAGLAYLQQLPSITELGEQKKNEVMKEFSGPLFQPPHSTSYIQQSYGHLNGTISNGTICNNEAFKMLAIRKPCLEGIFCKLYDMLPDSVLPHRACILSDGPPAKVLNGRLPAEPWCSLSDSTVVYPYPFSKWLNN